MRTFYKFCVFLEPEYWEIISIFVQFSATVAFCFNTMKLAYFTCFNLGSQYNGIAYHVTRWSQRRKLAIKFQSFRVILNFFTNNPAIPRQTFLCRVPKFNEMNVSVTWQSGALAGSFLLLSFTWVSLINRWPGEIILCRVNLSFQYQRT